MQQRAVGRARVVHAGDCNVINDRPNCSFQDKKKVVKAGELCL